MTFSHGQRLFIFVSAIFLSFDLSVAAAQVETVRTFTGGESPAAQGWTEATDPAESAPGRLVDEAWRIEDDDDSGPEWRSYEVTLSDDERDRARREGFPYRWRVRIPDETAKPIRAIGTEVAIRRKDGSSKLRFAVQMGRRHDELLAQFHTGPRGHVEHGLRVKNADDFHDWELAFDGKTQTINLRVDGQLLIAERCEHEDHGPHLLFGSRATDVGVSEWERVEFLIGKPQSTLAEPPRLPFVNHVYISRTEGYHTYRTPALIVTKKGTLLAFAHGRKESVHDLGNQDMILRRSTDNGKTWSPMRVLLDEGKATVGTPAPIVDRETGRIIAVFHIDARRVYTMYSDDEGLTWSKPVEITAQVSQQEWKMIATAPGIGIQIRHGRHAGRLVVPAYYRLTEHKGSSPFAYVMYSDDFGETWKHGESAGPETCEAQVAETKDGGLIINARNHWARTGGRPDLAGKRIIARSNDGGATWSQPTFDAALIEPTCQASLLRYSFAGEGSRSRLLFANPADTPTTRHGGPRRRLTVRVSYDDGHTWPVSRLVDQGVTAYSTLARLPDGRVGLMYESGGYRRLTFAAFDLKWLGEE